MRQHAGERGAGAAIEQARDGEQIGAVRRDARTSAVAVDLDEHREAYAERRTAFDDGLRRRRTVEQQAEARAAAYESGGRFQLARGDADGIDDVRDVVLEEIGRFAEGRHRNADRPAVESEPGDFDALRGLQVRAQRDPETAHARAHARKIALELRARPAAGRG